MSAYTTIFLALACGLLTGGAVGFGANRLGHWLGLLDFPDVLGGRKRHSSVTPLVGGLAVIAATLIGVGLALVQNDVDRPVSQHLAWLAGCVLVMGLVGMADDRFGLSARFRLAGGIIVLAAMVAASPDFSIDFLRFSTVDHLILLGGTSGLFTLMCLVGLLNAVNMADGKNGLVISLTLLWLVLLFPAIGAGVQPVLAAVIGALAALLPFNMASRLFLGDSGSYALSALAGLTGIYAYSHAFDVLPADRVALLFAVPVIDTIRLITVRASRGRSPFAPDRDHYHHHLAHRWGWPGGLVVYLLLVSVPNLVALLMPELTVAMLAVTAAGYLVTLVVGVRADRAEGFQPGQSGL